MSGCGKWREQQIVRIDFLGLVLNDFAFLCLAAVRSLQHDDDKLEVA